MHYEGIQTKAHNVPGVRKKLPAPFNGERIDLDGGIHLKRDWRDVKITDVKKGDTVAGFGTVAEVVEFVNVPDIEELAKASSIWRIRLHNVMGDYQDFPGEQRVFAFCPERTNG